jgi:biopolymer transport protein ExbB
MKNFILVEYFIRGGPMMYPLVLLSLISIVLFFERLITYIKVHIDIGEFVVMVKQLLSEGNIDGAIEFCESHKGPVAAIGRACILKYKQLKGLSAFKSRGKDKREIIEKSIETVVTEEVSLLEKGLIWLAAIINLAPVLGFTGTVTGMIKAFDAMAKTGLGDPTVVAHGISEALITTATGLIIAAPVIIIYNFFLGRVDSFVMEIEDATSEILDTIDNIESGVKTETK